MTTETETVTYSSVVPPETTVRRTLFPGPPTRISWGAIFAGAVAALSLWILLTVFGLALGVSAIDAAHPSTVRTLGVFTGLWSLLSPLIALLIGGAVASRGAGVATRLGGAMQGLVMWGITLIAGAYFVGGAVLSVTKDATNVGRAAINEAVSSPGALEDKLDTAANKAQQTAVEAAEVGEPVFWGVFGALALGLVAALVGGAAGVSRRQRMWADDVRRPVGVAGP